MPIIFPWRWRAGGLAIDCNGLYLEIGFGRRDICLGIVMAMLFAGCLQLNEGDYSGLLWNGLFLLTFFFGFIVLLRVVVTRESGRILWLNTRMVVLTALSAALYAAVGDSFKGIVLIPGVTDFRPGMALPPVMGILFGPAAAWGSGFGCIISDFFGSLSPGSFFGFIGNFAMAWLPYRLWWKTGLIRPQDPEPLRINSGVKAANFLLLSVAGAAPCALTIGWGLELLGIVPFKILSVLILVNNSAPVLLLSLPIILVLYPRIRRWGLLWTDILGEAGVAGSIQKNLGRGVAHLAGSGPGSGRWTVYGDRAGRLAIGSGGGGFGVRFSWLVFVTSEYCVEGESE